jgi:uncharacterized protein (TIGR00725 family)
MPRKRIIAAIGGNNLPEITGPARDFGRRVASSGAILLTGGDPSGDQKDVKHAAIRGCARAHGLVISILPTEGKPSCRRVRRRLVLRTGLTSFARDPITGAAADVVVVFRGAVGTLVELAYAAFSHRPIVFCDSLEHLGDPNENRELKTKLDEAIAGYPLIRVDRTTLMKALIFSLTDRSRAEVSSAEDAVAAALRSTDHFDPFSETNFLGLPGHKGIKQKFEERVVALSALEPQAVFD